MTRIIFALIFIFTTPSYASLHWSPKVLKQVNNQYPGSLKLVRKDLVQVITKKVTTTIKRTEKPTQFLINQKLIDLRNFKTKDDLTVAIKKMVPRSDLRASFWIMNKAHAQDQDMLDLAVPVIQSTITVTAQSEACESFYGFAKACTQLAHFITDSVLNDKDLGMESSDDVFKAKLTKWHAHLTVLKTNIDQKVVPLLGTSSEQIGKCSCQQQGKCSDPQDDVHFQMRSCTDGINETVNYTKNEGADLKASAQQIKELVKSVYTNSVPMDGAVESLNEVAK